VTGTPVGSDITDLTGQFDVLQMHPFTDSSFFATHVKHAYSGSMNMCIQGHTLLYMMGRCMIRHTKLQVACPILAG